MGGYGATLYRQWWSLFKWVGAFCIREVDHFVILPDTGVTYPFHSPHFCLALPTVIQFHDWLHCSWGSLSASINMYRHHSLCLMYVFLLRSEATSHYQWSSPVLSGCSSRHPWQKLQFPIFHPREALLVGHWVTALPLSSCGILFFPTSYRGSLAWGGAGTPVPCMMAAHTQGNANLWCDEKKLVLVEDSWPSALVCHFIRGDVSHNLMYHLPSLFFPPILDLPLSLPGICLH